ncbi:MAG: NIF family HAD-type phosphatase [bacterium]
MPILSYYNDPDDKELLDLIDYLKYLNNYEDLR